MKRLLTFLTILLFTTSLFTPISADFSSSLDQVDFDETYTAISQVELIYTLTITKVSLTMFVTYLQKSAGDSLFFDYVLLFGDHTDIVVTDDYNRNLLISASYDSISETTNVTFQLPELLDAGDSYPIVLLSTFEVSTDGGNYAMNSRVNWSQPVSVFSAVAYLDQNLILKSSSPPAQTTSIAEQRLKLTWDQVDVNDFSLVLTYEPYSEQLPISVFPSSWDLGMVPRSSKEIRKQITLTNLLTIPVNVTIFTEEEWISIQQFIELPPLADRNVNVDISISKTGDYSGIIRFLTNASQYAYYDYPITLVVETYISPLIILTIFFGILALVTLTSTVILFRGRKKIQDMRVEAVKIMKKYEVDYAKLADILKETEINVFKQVVDNPGITQSQIALNTGMSKASISRIIGKLEGKNLISKESVGMSNQIYVNDTSSIFEFILKEN